MQLDHRAAGAGRPFRRRAFEPGVDGDRVERRLAAHGVEHGSGRVDVAVEPEAGHRERRRDRAGRRLPRQLLGHGRRPDQRAECAGIERQHDVPRLERLLVGLDAPPGRRVQRPHRSAGAHLHPAALQVRPQRCPDAGEVVGVGGVEPDALGVAEEVVVEHRDQLGRRERGGAGEERPGERLEQHRLRAVGHAELGEEPRGGHVVEGGGGGGGVVGEELARQRLVGAEEVAQPEAGGAGEERDQVERRSAGQAGEVLRRPAPGDHRVAADRPQERQPGVDAAQDVAPRVVVPEEGVEPVLDHLRRAVREGVRPRAEPPAQRRRGLQQRDGHPALGQHHGRAHARDAAADDHGLRARRNARRPARIGGHQHAGLHAERRGARSRVHRSAGYGMGALTSQRKQSSTRTRSGAGAARGRRMKTNDTTAAATTSPAEISTDVRNPALSAVGSL